MVTQDIFIVLWQPYCLPSLNVEQKSGAKNGVRTHPLRLWEQCPLGKKKRGGASECRVPKEQTYYIILKLFEKHPFFFFFNKCSTRGHITGRRPCKYKEVLTHSVTYTYFHRLTHWSVWQVAPWSMCAFQNKKEQARQYGLGT